MQGKEDLTSRGEGEVPECWGEGFEGVPVVVRFDGEEDCYCDWGVSGIGIGIGVL